jgi:hypothetical protein
VPPSWSGRYREAIVAAAAACGHRVESSAVERAVAVLEHYNTRLKPRVREVPERVIFSEVRRSGSQPAIARWSPTRSSPAPSVA